MDSARTTQIMEVCTDRAGTVSASTIEFSGATFRVRAMVPRSPLKATSVTKPWLFAVSLRRINLTARSVLALPQSNDRFFPHHLGIGVAAPVVTGAGIAGQLPAMVVTIAPIFWIG